MRALLGRHFHVCMAGLIVMVVLAGFGPGLGTRLFAAPRPLPLVLHLHVALCSAWVMLFATQTWLASRGSMRLHRRLGMSGVAVGAVLAPLGLLTALVMGAREANPAALDGSALSIPLNDMASFAACFWLALCWRKRPGFHARLMLIATCCLTVAAFARLPPWLVPELSWYLYVDALIVLGALRDLWLEGRVHTVYRYALPALAASQAAAMGLMLRPPPFWSDMSASLLRAFL
jgi:hypothetical protein